MCGPGELAADGSTIVSTGDERRCTIPDEVTVEFVRNNYVSYPDLGDNLRQDVWAFIGRALSPTLSDFELVGHANRDELLRLFSCNRAGQILPQFRHLMSHAIDRYIYIYNDSTNEIAQIHYRGTEDWDCDVFAREGDEWQATTTIGSQEDAPTFPLAAIQHSFAIAMPCPVSPASIHNIFQHGGLQSLCQVRLAQTDRPNHRQFLLFDPGHIIDHAVRVIEEHGRWMRIVDAREPIADLGSLNPHQRTTRKQGILTILSKQLLDRDSGALDATRTRRLRQAYDNYTVYGRRRALFIDDMFNFVSHEIMTQLQANLLTHQEGNVREDGVAWLRIIASLAEIAGQHDLLVSYFQDDIARNDTQSSFASFYRVALRQGSAPESRSVTAWNRTIQAGDFVKLVVGVAETRTYILVNDYVRRGSRTTWSAFNGNLQQAESSLTQFCSRIPARVRESRRIAERLGTVTKVIGWANRLGQLRRAYDSPGSADSLSVIMDTMAELFKQGGSRFAGQATRATALKNVIDLYRNARDMDRRLGTHDYVGAFGSGVAVAAGLVEVGYISYMLATTGTLCVLTGPVGVAVAILGAFAAIVVLVGSQSDARVFLRHSRWGQHYGTGERADWSDGPLRTFNQRAIGLDRQLNSVLNLMHNYRVKHHFSDHNWVLGLEMECKFIPDTARFEFKGQFSGSGGRGRVQFSLQFTQRTGRQARMSGFQQDGIHPVTRANVEVLTEGGNHLVRVYMTLNRNLGLSGGRGWLTCYPFEHTEFIVPQAGDYQKNSFNLENLVRPTVLWVTHEFRENQWAQMPRWTLTP